MDICKKMPITQWKMTNSGKIYKVLKSHRFFYTECCQSDQISFKLLHKKIIDMEMLKELGMKSF